MIDVHLDFETKSCANIKKVSAAKYTQDPTTEILCLSYSIGDSPEVTTLKRPFFVGNTPETVQCPPELLKFAKDPNYRFVAHNAFFEFCVWYYILHLRYGWPLLTDPHRWKCTLAKAAAANLPFALGPLGEVLKLESCKLAELGAYLIDKLCVPHKFDPIGDPIWNEDPALFEDLYLYNARDVVAEKEVDRRLPDLTALEQRVWELDLKINHRGILSDVVAADKALKMKEALVLRMNQELFKTTEGKVERVTQNERIQKWLESKHGIVTDSLDKEAVTNLFALPNLPEEARRVIYLRQQGSKSSTSKYKTILMAASAADNRIRGALQFDGAGTGRWAGRLVQFHNLPQGTEKDPETAIEMIKAGDVGWFEIAYPKPVETLVSCIRGISVIAPEGKKLVCADYVGIEPRVLMWLAGETEALEMLRSGKNLYVPMAEYIFKKKPGEITKHGTPFEYKVGKETILGSGYQMWWPRFLSQCATKGIVLGSDKPTTRMTDADTAHLPESDQFLPWEPGYDAWLAAGGRETQDAIAAKMKTKKKRPMTEAEVQGMDAIVGYREMYAKVPKLWKEAEEAAKNAVKNPGVIYTCASGKIKYGMSRDREFLCCQLPSGRWLSYYHPSVRAKTDKYGRVKESLFFWGEDSTTGQWVEQHTYGGKLVENFVQAISRDILAWGMLNCEAAGFEVVLTVHDEVVAEMLRRLMEAGILTLEKFIECMCDLPIWAKEIPISAEGWIGERYKK